MIKKIKKIVDDKEHEYHEISKEILYKNRLVKSVYFMLLLIFSFTINVFIVYFNLNGKINGTVAINIIQIYMFIGVALGIILLPYHHKYYGFTLNKLKFNLLTAIPVGLVGLTLSIIVRVYMYKTGGKEFGFYFNPLVFTIRFFSYILICIIQEAITKGYFQSYFIAVFDGLKYNKALSISIASLVFAQFHILYGFHLVLITFVYSVLSGIYYEKSRSLVGVSIVHFFCGAGIFFFSKLY